MGSEDDRSRHVLWTTTGPCAAFSQLTIPAERALGRALHSPGLTGPPPWPGGRVCHALCPASRELRARGSADDRSTSPTSPETMPAAWASVMTASGAVWAVWVHLDRSHTSERPLCRQPPNAL